MIATQERTASFDDRPDADPISGQTPEPRTRRWRCRIGRMARGLARSLGIIVLVVLVAALTRQLGLDSIPAVALASIAGLGAITVTRKQRRRTRRRAVRIGTTGLVVALLAGLSASTWSYVGYLAAPGAATTAVRSSDWMRDHHMNAIVDRLEQTIYSGPPPADGRVTPSQLPSLSIRRASRPVHVSVKGKAMAPALVPGPAPVTGLIDTNLKGEGQWVPSARRVDGRPVDDTTFIRPDRTHTDVVASAVWFDPQVTRTTYVPGTKQTGPWAWGSGVPASERPNLVAAFNSGFKFKDIPGGYRTEGRTPVPLVDGQASLVLHAHGPAELGAWGSEVKLTSDVTSVRQNLALIVDNGQPDPGLRTTKKGLWGSRRWQIQYTNRSGVGITSQHALVFVAGANLTTHTLAKALVDAGCVRAMELDIHASNPTLNFFSPGPGGASGEVTGTKLYPAMKSAADRFLAPDQRDFFAVTVDGPSGR